MKTFVILGISLTAAAFLIFNQRFGSKGLQTQKARRRRLKWNWTHTLIGVAFLIMAMIAVWAENQ